MFILSAVALLENMQATSDSSGSEFLICDIAIEHQINSVHYASFNFMKSRYSPALRLHFVSYIMF